MAHCAFVAAFHGETARAPVGMEPEGFVPRDIAGYFAADREKERRERVQAFLQQHRLDELLGAKYKVVDAVPDGNALAYQLGPYCHYATEGDVHVLFSGEVSQWPGIDSVASNQDAFMRNDAETSDAAWLLQFYQSFPDPSPVDLLEEALVALAATVGSFGFVIYDARHHRVLAGRDAQGAQPLWWGCTPDGIVAWATSPELLDGCEPSATPFPAGCLYASQGNLMAWEPGNQGWTLCGEQYPGRLASFVPGVRVAWKPVKMAMRIDEEGHLHGSVYRVASRSQVEAAGAVSDKQQGQSSIQPVA